MSTFVYRNLNKPGYWSIKQDGIVVGHCTSCVLNDVAPHVGGSHDRVRAKNIREVFAWLVGDLVSVEGFVSFKGREVSTIDAFPARPFNRCELVTFHPHSAVKRGFIWADNNADFLGASCAWFGSSMKVVA